MRVLIMVHTRSSARYTPEALDSLFKHSAFASSDQVHIIDNDGSLNKHQLADSLKLYPQLRIVEHSEPKSFAANANIGVRIALETGADLILLNNDIILSDGWMSSLEQCSNAIVSPLSTRETHYAVATVASRSGQVVDTTLIDQNLVLEDYLRKPLTFAHVASVHRTHTQAVRWPVLVAPFFCTLIPNQILAKVGELDESFGPAGGEDYDYCLRTYLAGFEVHYALNCLVVHFGGKSTWDGAESKPEQLVRETKFKQRFKDKWGELLFEAVLHEQIEHLKTETGLPHLDTGDQMRLAIQRALTGVPR